MYSATIGSSRYAFPDLKTLLAKASPLRSGDVLAGVAAASGEERVAAQYALADLPLATFLAEHVVPYESDEVTRLIVDTHDRAAFATDRPSDGRRIARLAPVGCVDRGHRSPRLRPASRPRWRRPSARSAGCRTSW